MRLTLAFFLYNKANHPYLGGRPGDQNNGAIFSHILDPQSASVCVSPKLSEAALEAVKVHLHERSDGSVSAGGRVDQVVCGWWCAKVVACASMCV